MPALPSPFAFVGRIAEIAVAVLYDRIPSLRGDFHDRHVQLDESRLYLATLPDTFLSESPVAGGAREVVVRLSPVPEVSVAARICRQTPRSAGVPASNASTQLWAGI